jgi:enamine deaminase RidA (YjgF/YER057c/UK114 family)
MPTVIQPRNWPRPRGYANGIAATGRIVAVGGQIGGRPPAMELPREFAAQFVQAVDNVIEVVRAAGGQPPDIVSMTIFVTDQRPYHAAMKEIGDAWRERFGKHFPAMALVEVKGLMEPRAQVEIQAMAVIEEGAGAP